MNKLSPGSGVVLILSGHYGSGKTEISLNMSQALRESSGSEVTLADLDIINPYFRSRERKELLESKGIHLIGGSINDSLTGVPALSAEVKARLANPKGFLLLDTGGDPEGIRLLGRYRDELSRLQEKNQLSHFFVYNPFRPETSSLEKGIAMLRNIEKRAGIPVTDIICNGHFLRDTCQEDIRNAWNKTGELSRATGLPIAICTVPEWVLPPEEIPREKIILITLYMRSDWMS